MKQPLVVLDAVGKRYAEGDPSVLDQVSLTIAPGAKLALLGRSGSGKSTLLHLVSGLELPTRGKVEWPALGKREDLLPGKIGIMFQSRSLIPWLDVLENVVLPLQIMSQDRSATTEALEVLGTLGIEELARKLPGELSGGQAQRVALARAMVTRPRLLLADEPTGQLDHSTRMAVMAILNQWADRHGAALLIATHDPEVAADMEATFSVRNAHLIEVPS